MGSPRPPQAEDTGFAGLGATTLSQVIALWFVVAPWFFGLGDRSAMPWNNVVVGLLVVLLGTARLSNTLASTSASWCNAILGVWIFFSPWLYAYTANILRFVNSLSVGIAIVVLSLRAAVAPLGRADTV